MSATAPSNTHKPRHGGGWTVPGWLTSGFRPRPRVARTLQVCTAVALALGATAFVVTRSASAPAILGTDAGAWLLNTAVGTASHVNGLSGIADGEVTVPNAQSGAVALSRQSDAPLAVDETGGRLGLIDPKLQSFSWLAGIGAEAIVRANQAAVYVVEQGVAEARRYDAATLAPEGAIKLPGTAVPSGQQSVAMDGGGTLWIANQKTGDVTPVGVGGVGRAVHVANAGDVLALSAVTGDTQSSTQIIVLDETSGATSELAGGRVRGTLLVGAAGQTGALRLGSATAPSLIPVLRPAGLACDLVIADFAAGSVSSLRLRDSQSCNGLFAPVAEAGQVYVPDDNSGSLMVYDAGNRSLAAPVPVTAGMARFDVFALGGQVWANDLTSPAAVVIGPGGTHHIVKYGLKPATGASSGAGPTATPSPSRSPSASGQARPSSGVAPHVPSQPLASKISSLVRKIRPPSRSPGKSPSPSTSPSSTPKPSASSIRPTPSPSNPGPLTLTAVSGPAYVDLTVTPPPGLGQLTYDIHVSPPQSTTVERLGPTKFRVHTPLCVSNVYAFWATATLPDGRQLTSPTVDAYGCVPPGPVSQLAVTGGDGRIDVTWFAPANPGALTDQVFYGLGWVDDNNGAGGPTNDALVDPSQADASGRFTYHINALMGAHVLVGIEAVNGSGQGTLSSGEATAWDLTKCASPATTCTYNHAAAVALEMSPGGAPTSTSLPGTADGTFGAAVTVLCQTTGPSVTVPTALWAPSSVWDDVSFGGTTGYVSDLMVSTTNSMLTTATPQYNSC